MSSNSAIFAAGCFWGVEDYFSKIAGVISTKVGYSGGKTDNPTYEEVCGDNTGHAECVLVKFDTDLISYDSLLQHFWKCHNPTTLNFQGRDIGSQYRSAIFYLDEEQRKLSLSSKEKKSKDFQDPIVTEIKEASKFFLAEDYHQKYLKKASRAKIFI